jgi:hypothetical protein
VDAKALPAAAADAPATQSEPAAQPRKKWQPKARD